MMDDELEFTFRPLSSDGGKHSPSFLPENASNGEKLEKNKNWVIQAAAHRRNFATKHRQKSLWQNKHQRFCDVLWRFGS